MPWRLIAVLVSSCPLSEQVAIQLYHVARSLHEEDGDAQSLYGDIVAGEVRNLREHTLLGTLSGPSFEADVDVGTARGKVRFLLTRAGLAQPARGTDPAADPKMLN